MQNDSFKTIIITGCNRGLGYALIKLICENEFSPHKIIFTARDYVKGQEKFHFLKQEYPNSKIIFHQLDVNNLESINIFTQWISENHKNFDILVNNAGLFFQSELLNNDIPSEKIIKATLDTNFYGLVDLTQTLLPFLSPNGKIINVSSILGSLDNHKKEIRELLLDSNLTTEKLIDLAKDYEQQIRIKKIKGWSHSSYNVSKSLVNAYTRFALRKTLKENQMIMAVNPGWCKTDMGGLNAPFSDMDGAKKIYYLMFDVPFLNDEKYNFNFFSNNTVYEENQ